MIDDLDDILDRYNNTYTKIIKMKPIDVKTDSFAEYNENLMKKILNLKLVIKYEYQNTQIFLQKDMLPIGMKEFLS